MKRYLRLLALLFKYKLARDMVYSFNFWMAFFVDTILFIFHLLAFSAIYSFTDSINGWSLNQVYIFIGTFTILDSINMGLWFFGLTNLKNNIHSGILDLVITKPINTQFYVSFQSFNPGSLFGVIIGTIMIIIGVNKGGFQVDFMIICGYILLCIMMLSVFYSLMLIFRTFAFFFIKIDALEEVENSLIEIAFQVPGSVFQGVPKVIFMVILPYGLISTAPTEFITGLFAPAQWIWVSMVTIFFTVFSILFFRFGLSKYSSAGG